MIHVQKYRPEFHEYRESSKLVCALDEVRNVRERIGRVAGYRCFETRLHGAVTELQSPCADGDMSTREFNTNR